MNPHDWFTKLAMEMVDNTLDSGPSPRRKRTRAEASITPQPTLILDLGTLNDEKDGCLVQPRCKICSVKCTSICTLCTSDRWLL